VSKTKIYYFNDERSPITVKTQKLGGEPWENDFVILNQQEGRLFEVEIPEGNELWIKKWPNMVMLSWISVEALSVSP